MATKSFAAPNGAREKTAHGVVSPTADNDAEPFEIRDVTAELSLRARAAPQVDLRTGKRAAAS